MGISSLYNQGGSRMVFWCYSALVTSWLYQSCSFYQEDGLLLRLACLSEWVGKNDMGC